jgi:hypothetical protein
VKPAVRDEGISSGATNTTEQRSDAIRRTVTVGPVVDDHNRRVLRRILGRASKLGAVHVVRGHTGREPSDTIVIFHQD